MHDRKVNQGTEKFDGGTVLAAVGTGKTVAGKSLLLRLMRYSMVAEGASVLLFCANDRDVNDNLAAWGIAGKGMCMPSRNDEDTRHE